MRKILFITVLSFVSQAVFASPARFGGFSYSRDETGRVKLSDETLEFNQTYPPASQEDPPQTPFYLDEESLPSGTTDKYTFIYSLDDVYNEMEKDSPKYGSASSSGKYNLIPTYSVKELYENKNHTVQGQMVDDADEGEDDDFGDEEE